MATIQTTQSSAPPPKQRLVRGYTFALGVIAVFFVLGAVTIYSTAPAVDESIRWAHGLTARLSLVVAALCGFVAFLRARQSPFATHATTAFNVLLAIYFPFGTAAAAYWWFSIRPRERQSHAA